MILINGKEVIDDVRINEDGTFETTDVPDCFWMSDKTEVIEKERFVDNKLPYVECPSFVHVKNETRCYVCEEIGQVDNVICETGYINIDNGQKELAPIQIGNVGIRKLLIKTKVYSRGHCYNELYFHYKFVIKICIEEEDSLEYTFYADTIQQIRNYFQKQTYNSWPINTLLRQIIPALNVYINSGYSIEQVNFAYLNQLLPQKEKNYIIVHPFSFTDALDIIYSLQVVQNKDSILITVGKDLKPYMNLYIVSLINSILNITLQYDKEAETYKATLESVDYPDEIISLRNYLQCLLYFGIYENFETEKARAQYLVLPSTQNDNKIVLHKDYLNDHPSSDFLGLFDFISDMEATHIEDGIIRVGRDDREWKEKTIIIPYKKHFWASDIYIEKINELLDVKLEFQGEQKSECLWNSDKNHPARYYFFERYDDDYVAGLACCRHDIGSYKLRQESFYKLLDYFMKKYISSK